MDRETLCTADKFRITKKVKELETALMSIENVSEIKFNLEGFYDGINEIVLCVYHTIPLNRTDFFETVGKMKDNVVATALNCGLARTKDRVEDYGKFFCIVFDCDESWDEKTIE